ncbi:MAG: FAD binding domain-containing protein [Acetobacteraceae bacterium]|nr:FAD binding domain-containing protein [Acetobacteraceae bacterium]
MDTSVSFFLNDKPVRIPPGTSPTMTLLDWLRGPGRLTGTKEGCAEGDCGACTVVLERHGRRMPVNACLLLLGQLHRRRVRTVEGLGGAHPAQTLMAESDGTQCGFCTPGIVMSLYAHAQEGGDPHEALAGNLCRCTGYRPILDAIARLPPEPPSCGQDEAPPAARFETADQVFHLPNRLADLLDLRAADPAAWLLAGGTDLGLRVSEHRERPPSVICVQNVPDLSAIESRPEGLVVGAAVPYRDLLALCEAEAGFEPLRPYLGRLGSRQIRSLGTVGGNLGTASPIGDMLPPLVALGAGVRLASRRGERVLPVEEFLLDYRRTALAEDEVILSVFLPRPPAGRLFVVEKLSRRHDQDISAVAMAATLDVADGVVRGARLAFGGMAATARRAEATEAALLGRPLAEESFAAAAEALRLDFSPLSDWRGSAEYRLAAAGGLLRRLFWRAAAKDLPHDVMSVPAPHAPAFAAGTA